MSASCGKLSSFPQFSVNIYLKPLFFNGLQPVNNLWIFRLFYLIYVCMAQFKSSRENLIPLSHHRTCRSASGGSVQFQSMLVHVVIKATDQASLGQYFFRNRLLQAGFCRHEDVMITPLRRFTCKPFWYPEFLQSPFPFGWYFPLFPDNNPHHCP